MGFFRVLGGWGSPPHGLPAQQQLSACPPAWWSASPPACWGDPPNFALLMINQWGFLAGGLLEKRTRLEKKTTLFIQRWVLSQCWESEWVTDVWVNRVSSSVVVRVTCHGGRIFDEFTNREETLCFSKVIEKFYILSPEYMCLYVVNKKIVDQRWTMPHWAWLELNWIGVSMISCVTKVLTKLGLGPIEHRFAALVGI